MSALRSTVRQIAAAPWLTAVIVSSLALGTGANAAVYSAVDALLFRAPPGVVGAADLVDIYTSQLNGGTFGTSSYPDLLSIAATPSLEAAAAVEEMDVETVAVGNASVTARVAAVSAGFWPLLGMPTPTVVEPVAVISADLWRSLGSEPNMVGRTAKVGARQYVIGAVAPAGFRGLHLDRVFDVWVPLDAEAGRGRGDRRLAVIGRLRASVPLDGLQHELDPLAPGLAAAHPATNKGTLRNPEEPRRMTAAAYARLDPAVRGRATLFGAALLGATALLLFSSCVNAGSLLLSRGMARRTELAIKIALGADRQRLVREAVLPIEGRLFTVQDDRPDSDVVIVNEALALRFFAGRATRQSLVAADGRTVRIIGSVQTRSYRTFEGVQRPIVFYPISRSIARVVYAAVRLRPDAAQPERNVAAALTATGTARTEVLGFHAFLRRALGADRLTGRLIGACGAIALGLALIGVYGVMIDAVRRRRREFALRAALGAGRTDIVVALIGSTLTPAAAGIAGGVASAVLLSRLAAAVVYGLPGIDAVLVVEVVLLLLLVVLTSVAGPARRAVKVSPLLALRH